MTNNQPPVRLHDGCRSDYCTSAPVYRGRRSASVLLAVFWMMAALSLVIFTAIIVVNSDMEVIKSESSGFRALQLAETGVAIAANGVVEEFDPILTQYPVTDQALLDYFEFGPNEGFLVKIRSEAGWMNINQVLGRGDRDLLERMFNYWGMDLTVAQEVVAALVDWVDEDEITSAAPEGAEMEWYEDNGLGDGNYPFNRAFYDIEEMRLVKGMDLVEAFKPNWRDYFTVYSEGQIDINEASAELIAIAAETEEEWVEDLILTRNGPDEIEDTEDDLPFASVEEALTQIQSPADRRSIVTPRFTTQGGTVRIESTGIVGDFRRKLVLIIRNRGTRPALLSRQEVAL